MNLDDLQPAVSRRALWCWLLVLALPLGCRPEASGPATAPTNTTTAPQVSVLVPLTNMVLIKAGSFLRLRQRVTLSHDYWLGKYEVTQAEYAALTGANPSHFTGQPEAPVEKVRHSDALAYCATLTQRERQANRLPPGYQYGLPSEAQWEYACRAGTTTQFSFGDAGADADAYAWTWENSGGSTHPVGQKLPNPWGLHDMHGNVWEWCSDWFGDYPAMPVTDPSGPRQGKVKVFRGGGWNNEAPFARSSNRFAMAPASGIHFVGFRVALSPTRNP